MGTPQSPQPQRKTTVTERLMIQVAAADRLADAVALLGLPAPLVLGMPPGGLQIALRVARALQAPVDMLVQRPVDQPVPADRRIAWPLLAGRSAVIVDDGHADPLHWHAALASLQPLRPDCLAIIVPELSEAIETALAIAYEHQFSRHARPHAGGSMKAPPSAEYDDIGPMSDRDVRTPARTSRSAGTPNARAPVIGDGMSIAR
jgi:predicted phosphoribosyltransferase